MRPQPWQRATGRVAGLLAAAALLTGGGADADVPSWDSRRLAIPVVVGEHQIPYPEFALYVMPGEPLSVTLSKGDELPAARLDGTVLPDRSPRGSAAPGVSRLEVDNPATGETAVIHLLTLVPSDRMDRRGVLNGYRMGRYPQQPLRGLAIYRPPRGFVEVTEANRDLKVSPNFRLGQFVSKQDQGYPKYVVLRPGLLLKLEAILAELNRSGRPTGSLVVMSGYRTPWYNRAIGNVAYSRHVWGGAADIYIDEHPADGVMDDLDGNGRIDRDDARWLAQFVDAMSRRRAFGPRIGGLGVYGSNAAHGPFIHVDVRGTAARW